MAARLIPTDRIFPRDVELTDMSGTLLRETRSVPSRSVRRMSQTEKSADQLMCEHRWVKPTVEGALPRCGSCDLGWADYVQGTVRSALTRVGAWD